MRHQTQSGRGCKHQTGRVFLRFPLVKKRIQQQIQGEVDNIKASMENIYGDAGRHKLEAQWDS